MMPGYTGLPTIKENTAPRRLTPSMYPLSNQGVLAEYGNVPEFIFQKNPHSCTPMANSEHETVGS